MTTQRAIEPHEFVAYAEASEICRHCDRGRYAAIHESVTLTTATDNRAGGEQEHSELEYIETRYGAEIGVGNLRLRAHWQGLADIEDNRSLFQFIVKACNEHHQLCSALTKASEFGLGYQKRIEQLEQVIRDQMSVLRDWRGADNVPQQVRDAMAIRLTELRRVVEGK